MVRRILIIAIHCDQLWRIFFAAFLAVLSTVSSAQHHQADSVNALLIGKADGERADIFYELSYQYGDQDYALALGYSDRSLQFARRSGDSLRIVKAARIKAWIFRQLEEMDSSIRLGLEMLPIASRNHYNDEVKKIMRGLPLAYSFKANFDRGLQYHFELLRITEQDGDSVERAFVFNNIGMVYMQLLNYKKALHYFHRSLAIDPPLYEIKMTTVLLNTSLCYSQLRDFEKAREYLQKGFDKSQSTHVGTIAIEGLNVKGSFYLTKGELDSAETFFLRSYALAKDCPVRGISWLLYLNWLRYVLIEISFSTPNNTCWKRNHSCKKLPSGTKCATYTPGYRSFTKGLESGTNEYSVKRSISSTATVFITGQH